MTPQAWLVKLWGWFAARAPGSRGGSRTAPRVETECDAQQRHPFWTDFKIFGVAQQPVFPYSENMEVQLTPEQKAFARRAIESGRLHSEQDAVQEALVLWEERERQRTEFLQTLDDAKASLARGEGRDITQESTRQLAQEVKDRGRARLLAELTASL